MAIKTKLRLTFGLFFCLLIAVVASTTVILNAQKADGVQINLAGRQRMLTQRMTKEFFQFVTAGSADKAAEDRVRLGTTVALFDKTLSALRNGGETTGGTGDPVTLPPAKDEAVIAALDEGIALWETVGGVLTPVLDPGVPVDSEQVRVAGVVLSRDNVPLLKVMNKVTGAFQAASDGRRQTLTALQYGAVVLGLVVAIGAGIFVHRAVLGPIHRVMRRIDELANGDGDLTIRLPGGGTDEIAILSTEINNFIEQVHKLVSESRASALEVAGSAEELRLTFDEIASESNRQQIEVERIAAATEQSAASSSHVAEQIESMTTHASKSGELASRGADAFSSTVDDLGKIRSSVQHAGESIGTLGQCSEQIGSVIAVINDIADQTNLLALNAAIEAARAGEHGRGFAVVADEVRKLADRTTTATEEISGQITSIQTETKTAEERMGEGEGQVLSGVDRARKGAFELDSLRDGATELTRMVEHVAAAAEEQSMAAQSVSQSLGEITNSIGMLSGRTGEAQGSIALLSQKSEQLRSLVERFKL